MLIYYYIIKLIYLLTCGSSTVDSMIQQFGKSSSLVSGSGLKTLPTSFHFLRLRILFHAPLLVSLCLRLNTH